jgi:tetratricopeptide (TPR) repeat protein
MGVDEVLARAEQHYRAGDIDTARKLFAETLTEQPDNAHALHALGRIAVQTGDIDTALSHFTQAIARHPGDASGFAGLANTLVLAGRLEEAEHCYKAAIERDPKRPGVHLGLGNALSRSGRFDEAVAAYRNALELAPELAEAHCNIGAVYKETGRLKEAVHAYELALESRPAFARAHANLGAALVELGDFDGAVRACQKAVELAPTVPGIHVNLGVALKEQGKLEAAVAAYRRAVELAPAQADTYINLANALKAMGDLDGALLNYDRARERSPDSAQAHANMGAVLIMQDRPRDALELCDAYLRDRPTDSRVTACKVAAMTELGQNSELAQLMCFERITKRVVCEAAYGFASIGHFNEALVTHILAHSSLTDSPTSHATRCGKHTGELFADPLGPMGSFKALVETNVASYLHSVRELVSHPYFDTVPDSTRITAWAVVMRAEGHQIGHIHPTAWVSGVYYAELPRVIDAGEDREGWIEFGDYRIDFPGRATPALLQLKPERGTMILFPSYLYHRTIPFDSEERRVSVAFDILPRFSV